MDKTISILSWHLTAVAVNMERKMKQNSASKTNYRMLFTFGIIFTGAGIAIGLMPMMALGLVFMFLGLLNKNKWTDEDVQETK